MATRTINGVMLALIRGNIVEVPVDAIVNAANSGLRGGGGVDGAIHRAGGPRIMEECRKIGGCPTGEAVVSTAGRLPAKYVFHAVGPIYGGSPDDERLLASAYQSCLNLAEKYEVKNISFPSLSTGIYGYPLELAAPVALQTIIEHVKKPTCLQQVLMVLFGEHAYKVHEQALDKLL